MGPLLFNIFLNNLLWFDEKIFVYRQPNDDKHWKIQFMILNNTTVNHLIEILDKKIALSKLLKLLGLTIDI